LPPKTYTFKDRLGLSQGYSQSKNIKEILLAQIPGALQIIPAHLKNDKHGTDWWIELAAGKFLSVDVKVREEDFALKPNGGDDLALETFSVVEKQIVGWTRSTEKQTDYILWLWIDSGRWCLVPFPMLCKVFTDNWERWIKLFKKATQRTPQGNGFYTSECVFVPRKEVWSEIYRVYGGNPKNPKPPAPPSTETPAIYFEDTKNRDQGSGIRCQGPGTREKLKTKN